MNEDLYKLKQEFLEEWPLERLQNMNLEEYTNTNRENSFCYWLESKTTDLGSFWGGSSYKFGIYKIANNSKTESKDNRKNDGVYAWLLKYGNSREEAFGSVKNKIIQVVKAALSGELEQISAIDLGYAYKLKIAFLFSDYKVLNMFKNGALKFVAKYLGYNGKEDTFYRYNEFILSHKKEEDFYEFSSRYWSVYQKNNSIEGDFKKWLKENEKVGSGKVSSYLRAISILITHFKIEVYTEKNIEILQDLYTDLILHQKDSKGKYYYNVAKSYGKQGYYSSAIASYIEFIEQYDDFESDQELKKEPMKNNNIIMNNQSLNTILYGPPGTGKTYTTVQKAVEIVNPAFEIIDSESGRKLLKNEYDRLVEEGQIVFTTFHQSMAYEDFVEGIKPETKEDQLIYSIEDGVFKQLIEDAKELPSIVTQDNVDFSNSKFFKMSLGGKHRKSIHDWCLNNDYIALGWGGEKDLHEVEGSRFKEEFYELNPSLLEHSKYHVQSSSMFKNYMEKGDVVIATLGNHVIDAIGIITGDYEFKESNTIHFKHYRKVKWLAKDLNSSPKSLIGKNISQQSIYEFNPDDVNVDKLESMFNTKPHISINEKLNYVLIIDEINRGNVSAIFGELITLLEESKRLGNSEALTVTLPYSKETFGVPNNLYIIGTMNTADRSVEALDTALRRRFSFEEMLPDASKIKTEKELQGLGIDLAEVFRAINQRIEVLLDRDHTIGHSYFMKIYSLKKLIETFKNNIVPLLQEYFYNDYAKIGLVLGKGFVEQKEVKTETKETKLFASFYNLEQEEYVSETYALKTIDEKFAIVEAIDQLLD